MTAATASTPAPAPVRRRGWVARGLRIALWVVAGLATLLLVGVLLLLLAPVREGVLRQAIVRADRALPGSLTVQQADWPALSRIELGGVLWTSEPDTMLALETLHVDVRLGDLWRKDLWLREFTLFGLRADLEALGRAFPPSLREEGGAPPASPSSPSFPRPGALPGIPSVVVESLAISAPRVRLPDGSTIVDVEAAGSLDLGAGREPIVTLASGRARAPEAGWSLDTLRLRAALADRELDLHLGASIGPEVAVALAVRPEPGGGFLLVAADSETRLTPDAGDLVLHGRFLGEARIPEGIAFDGVARVPGTAELRKYPLLAEQLADIPDLEGLSVLLEGALRWSEPVRSDLRARIEPNSWVRGGLVHTQVTGSTIAVDTLALHLPDLDLRAAGALSDSLLDVSGTLSMTGLGWLSLVSPEATVTEPLRGKMEFAIDGPVRAPGVSFSCVGEGTTLALTTRGEVRVGETIGIRLAPIFLSEPNRGPRPGSLPLVAKVDYDPAGGAITARDVTLDGMYGRLVARADLVSARAGTWALEARWPKAPAILARAFPETVTPDSLARLWSAEPEPRVQASGSFDLDADRVLARGGWTLPGPRLFAAFAPAGARLDDLSALRGGFTLEARPRAKSGVASLDLTGTEWLDTGTFTVRATDGRGRIDSATVSFDGVTLRAEGTAGDSLSMVAFLDISDARLLHRFQPAAAESLDLGLDARVEVGGTRDRPTVVASARGGLRLPALRVPSLSVEATWEDGELRAGAAAGPGVRAGELVLDTVDVRFTSAPGAKALFPGRMDLTVQGPDLKLRLGGNAARDSLWRAEIDALETTWLGRDLIAARPFRLSVAPGPLRVDIADLDLAGSLGSVRGRGRYGPDELTADLVVDVVFPSEASPAGFPADLWPERGTVTLLVRDSRSLSADVTIQGLSLGETGDLVAVLRTEIEGGRAAGTLGLSGAADTLVAGRFDAPVDLSLAPFRLAFGEEAAEAVLTFNALPIPTAVVDGEEGPRLSRPVRLDGNAVVLGSRDRTEATMLAGVTFPDWPKLSAYRLDIDGVMVSRDGASRGLRMLREGDELLGAGLLDTLRNAAAGRIVVRRGGSPVLSGSLTLVGVEGLVRNNDRGSAHVDLHVDAEDLPLGDLSAFLPPGVALKGTSTLRLDARGPLEDPAVEGSLDARDVAVSLADGTRAAAKARLVFQGSGLRPAVRGRVEVLSGMIRVPDPPRALLPTEGPSVLWALDATRTAAEDSSAGVVAASPSQPKVQPDLDVTVSIPAALWIRGRGLNVELAGDLRVAQRGAVPTVTGELDAVRGDLLFLGRRLEIDRGKVVFYGEDEVDPTLDLLLTTRIREIGGATEYGISITVTGTVQNPDLALTSDPELTDGDIMSLMLFGKTMAGLETGQTTLLRERAAEVAGSFAASEMGARLSRQLGVDMISIQQGAGQDEASRLVVGKYLSRRALLKYEQALESGVNVFINLEYLLSRHFKVETLFGPQSQSAVQITWGVDY